MKKFEVGQEVWIIESNKDVTKAVVKKVLGDFYVILLESGAALRLRESRLFPSKEEATAALLKKVEKRKLPYDFFR